ncbi:DUF1289 domain-containing protein [Novosphingobium sp. YAF33]|uniref:DUF1289 domain-containing protein n=1 Tax=Novosphingobium sp. YAF33 TaxID=3233082 RepID=UPI003F9B1020
MSAKDPCISVCQFDGKSGWCRGCARTLEEVRKWRKLQPHGRKSIERELPRRLQRLAARDGG